MIGYRQSAIGGRRRLSAVSVSYRQSASAISDQRSLIISNRRAAPFYSSLIGFLVTLVTWYNYFARANMRS